ncbi:hypothetical protein PCL_07292 [Purpureocillium lilacinum]|uniref:Uncharacterized protein n=1 Tax=Purpureocillium lilacinum TaxID=33203 RepID=A0A2U3DSM2_PURLI|nr:hypothetical protein PCL_07292 [Purpureocillium lilacinum]
MVAAGEVSAPDIKFQSTHRQKMEKLAVERAVNTLKEYYDQAGGTQKGSIATSTDPDTLYESRLDAPTGASSHNILHGRLELEIRLLWLVQGA